MSVRCRWPPSVDGVRRTTPHIKLVQIRFPVSLGYCIDSVADLRIERVLNILVGKLGFNEKWRADSTIDQTQY